MRRQPVLRAAAAAVALAATGLAALAALVPAGATAAPPPPPFAEYYGIAPATSLSDGEAERIARSGTRTIRLPFYWPSLEPRPPEEPGMLPTETGGKRMSWGETDALVSRAAANGIRVLPFVYGTPDWLSDDPMRPPLDSSQARDAWISLLDDLARRYGPGGALWRENPDLPAMPITTWQIWNEPNSALYWAPSPNPAEYAQLMQLSAPALRGADPNAIIVLGGLFGTPINGIPSWRFLKRLYATPAIGETFDAYALHPYAPGLKGIKRQIALARTKLRRVDDRKLPLFITEIGWPTQGPAGYKLVKTLRGQKRMLAKSFRLFLEKRRPWKLRRVIWYTWRDNDVQQNCTVCRFSGLFDRQLQPKPAWRAFARFAGGSP